MIYILNFKNYLKREIDYLKIIKKLEKHKENFWLAINPYFYLNIAKKLKKPNLKLGLQNISLISTKPQTGEITPDFELIRKAKFVLIGHSERYRMGEDENIIHQKITTLQKTHFDLVIFFSENDYKPKNYFYQARKKIEKNLLTILKLIKESNNHRIYLVYEPWWAISSEMGKIPSLDFLTDFLYWYKKTLGLKFPLLYGGSYNSKIAKEFRSLDFDGYVLGKASTDYSEIKRIISLRVRDGI
ncbi:MAG: triose-phosphate isomerase [Patescibacteria group bacterium]|nr:triose-phosphate isomerase [Patescibacteria group bacterium]